MVLSKELVFLQKFMGFQRTISGQMFENDMIVYLFYRLCRDLVSDFGIG